MSSMSSIAKVSVSPRQVVRSEENVELLNPVESELFSASVKINYLIMEHLHIFIIQIMKKCLIMHQLMLLFLGIVKIIN